MNAFVEFINNKPSVVLLAIVEGLKEASTNPIYEIKPTTWGNFCDGIYHVGAVTCSVQKLTGHNFASLGMIGFTRRIARFLDCDFEDFEKFEIAVWHASIGNLSPLFRYCNLPIENEFNNLWKLDELNWKTELLKVEKTILDLRSLGC